MRLDTLGTFSAIFDKGDNFLDIRFCLSAHQFPLVKVSSLKREGVNTDFSVDSCSEGRQNNFDGVVVSLEGMSVGLRHAKTCLQANADSKGPDQPAHARSLIRALTVRSQNHWLQQNLWRAKARMILCACAG